MGLAPLTGLFLGAGASFEAGMPIVWELTEQLRNLLNPDVLRQNNEKRQASGDHTLSDRVLDDLIAMSERQSAHYEAVLGYLEVQFRRERDRKLAEQYHRLYSWLVEGVSRLLLARHIEKPDYLKSLLRFYDGLRALAEANVPLWVFSLNHDLIIELVAARLSIPIRSGFSDTTVTFPYRNAGGDIVGQLRGEVLTDYVLEKQALYFPNPPKPGINLLKVHGALDIFATNNEGKDLIKLLPAEPTENAIIKMLRTANENLFYTDSNFYGERLNAINEIAYADEQGVLQFLRRSVLAGAFKFDPRVSQVLPRSMLKHLQANINFVSTLVCIGYSFGDIHINNVLRDWLETSSERKLQIVDPVERPVPSFLLHLLPQISVIKSTATEYLDAAAGITRSRTDDLEKRISVLIRSKLSKSAKAAQQSLAEFHNADLQRVSAAFIEKLRQSVSIVDGKPDFNSLGEPNEVAAKWAIELGVTPEQFLEKLYKHLQAESGEKPN
jgi:hypothetical protein